MDIKGSVKTFAKARELMEKGMMEEAFDLYCDAFLGRISDPCCGKEFPLFFRLQMARYFCAKKNTFISLAEGDMVSDLIKCCYDQFISSFTGNPFCKTPSGRMRLLENLEIVFPVQNDTEESISKLAVSK